MRIVSFTRPKAPARYDLSSLHQAGAFGWAVNETSEQ